MFDISTVGSGETGIGGYRDTQPLHNTSPIALPKSATWNGINIEHHRQPPAECTLCLPQHTICILLSECHTERRVNGSQLHHNSAASGEIIVYPASSEHWIRWQTDTEFLLVFLDPALMTQAAAELAPRNSAEIVEITQEVHDPLVQQIGMALKAELDDGADLSSSLYAESLANTLSVHLLRRYAVWKPTQRDSATFHSASNLHDVVDYIHDNLDQHLTLAELAFIAKMSTYHFSRTFKQFTGVTPHQYVLNARVEQSKDLLIQGKLSFSEIATRVGFFDQSHFNRAFKRLVGVTPQALLREQSKNVQ